MIEKLRIEKIFFFDISSLNEGEKI